MNDSEWVVKEVSGFWMLDVGCLMLGVRILRGLAPSRETTPRQGRNFDRAESGYAARERGHP
jgi:hypothetical protein